MRAGIFVLMLAALAGCKDERPPHMATVCDEHHTTTVTTTTIINGRVGVGITPIRTCVRSHLECKPAGEDYTGDLTCADVMAAQ